LGFLFLLLSQQQVDHPTPADVRSRPPAVGEDLRVVAPGVFQGVGEDGELDGRILVDRFPYEKDHVATIQAQPLRRVG
jgi:hypothetical protein